MAAASAVTTQASGRWTSAHSERLLCAADFSEANGSNGSEAALTSPPS
jgi:hypothetical protein